MNFFLQHYEYDYWVRFKTDPGDDLNSTAEKLHRVFEQILDEVIASAKTFKKNVRGYLQVSLDSPNFPEINIPFVSITNVAESAAQLQRDISRRVQSSKNFDLTEGFKFSATLQHIDVGGGRVAVKNFASAQRLKLLTRKRSIIAPPDYLKEGLCLPAILVLAERKHVQNHSFYRTKKSRKKLEATCLQFLQEAGLQPGLLGPAELRRMVDIPRLRYFDISLWRCDGERTMYRRSDAQTGERCNIDILIDQGLYYLVTRPKALLNCRFLCRTCGIGRRIEYHDCSESGSRFLPNFLL